MNLFHFEATPRPTQIYEWPYKGQNLWCVGTLHFLGVLWLGLKEPRFTENSVDRIGCVAREFAELCVHQKLCTYIPKNVLI